MEQIKKKKKNFGRKFVFSPLLLFEDYRLQVNYNTDWAFIPLSLFRNRGLLGLHNKTIQKYIWIFYKIKWTLAFVPQTANVKVLYSQVVGVKFKF